MVKLLLALLLSCALVGHAQTYNPNPPANTYGTALALGAQTAATVNSANVTNPGFSGGHFLINVTAYTSGNYTPHIQGMEPISGTFYDILVGAAISATGLTVLKVYPGLPGTANAISNDILPATFRVQLIGASSPSMTISASYYLNP